MGQGTDERFSVAQNKSDLDPQARSLLRWYSLGLLAVIALAAVLRFNRLHEDSYWLDELYTLRLSRSADFRTLIARTERDVHPPLYYLLCWALVPLGGNPERLLRILPAIAGTLCVLALGLVVNALAGPSAGFGAAALLAINGFHIYLSREARSYALLSLLSVVSFGSLLVELQRSPRRFIFLIHVLSSTALLYTHYFGSILLACEAAAVLLLSKRLGRWRVVCALAGIAMSGLLYLPWLGAQLRDMRINQFWMSKPDGAAVLELLRLWWTPQPLAALLTGVLLLLGAVHAGSKRTSVPLMAILVWALGPLGIAYVKSQAGASIWMPRNLIVSLPGWILLMSLGLSSIRSRIHRWALLAAFVGASGWSLYWHEVQDFGLRGHVDLRGASAWLVRVNSIHRSPIYFHQLAADLGWYLDQAHAPGWSGRDLPSRAEQLPPVLWVIEGHGALAPEQKLELEQRHRALFSRDFATCRVTLYVPQGSQAQFDRFTELGLELGPSFVRQPRAESLVQWLGSRGEHEALLVVSTSRFWRFLSLREKQVLKRFVGAELAAKLKPAASVALLIDPEGKVEARVAWSGTEPLDARLQWPDRGIDVRIAGDASSRSRLAQLRIAGEELTLVPYGLMAVRLAPPFGEVTEFWGLDTRESDGIRASFKKLSVSHGRP